MNKSRLPTTKTALKKKSMRVVKNILRKNMMKSSMICTITWSYMTKDL